MNATGNRGNQTWLLLYQHQPGYTDFINTSTTQQSAKFTDILLCAGLVCVILALMTVNRPRLTISTTTFHVMFLLAHCLRVCTEPTVCGRRTCNKFSWNSNTKNFRQHIRFQPYDKWRWSKCVVRPFMIEQQTIKLQLHQITPYRYGVT